MSRTAFANRRASMVGRLALVISIVLPLGCGGDPSKPKLGRVSGKVTYNGAPVTKGLVTFVPTEAKTGQTATGEIGSDGSYRLSTFESGDGAVLGEHVVIVQSMETDPAIEGGSMPLPNASGGFDMQPPKHLLPVEYSSPQTSPLRYSVTEGRNSHDIALSD